MLPSLLSPPSRSSHREASHWRVSSSSWSALAAVPSAILRLPKRERPKALRITPQPLACCCSSSCSRWWASAMGRARSGEEDERCTASELEGDGGGAMVSGGSWIDRMFQGNGSAIKIGREAVADKKTHLGSEPEGRAVMSLCNSSLAAERSEQQEAWS